jgi:hypothetical protein
VRQETFVNYRGYRWLWLTTLALIACTAVYVLDNPIGGRNGGTIVGYTFGVLSALGIVWLMLFGMRKRAYASTLGTVQGWLAAHVWIGLGLLFLVPLHAGLSFGVNVHTLAYVLMVLTILSGLWGTFNYSSLAEKLESNRGGRKDQAVLEQVNMLSSDIEVLCANKSDAVLKIVNRFDFTFTPGFRSLVSSSAVPMIDKKAAGAMMLEVPEGERSEAIKIIGLIDQKADLLKGLLEEARTRALLKLWLYIHVPVSVGLCGALAIHILSVFYYW